MKKVNSRSITVLDVARHAGVSTATVSRALTGSRPMSEQLRDRVRASATELGYQVNLVGRALRKQRTSTLGLVIPDLENPFFSSLAQQVSRRFTLTQVDVLVASSDNDISLERRAVESFLGRQVDAIVVIPADEVESSATLEVSAQSVPTIALDRSVPGVPVPFVGVDNAAGMALVGRHLESFIDLDDYPAWFIGGGQSSSSGRERAAEFSKSFPDAPVLDGKFSFDWGQQGANAIVESGVSRGTIVAAADIIALGAMSFLTTSGFRVPEDFRIVGFDDLGVSRFAYPSLSTVRQPVEEMVDEIHRLVAGGEEAVQTSSDTKRFSPSWVTGQSSPETT